MQKRVFIIHCWEGHPEDGWYPWLKNELEKKGFEVYVPEMPDTDNPRIPNWIPAIVEAVDVANEQTYFVGHSMGCQAIARYIETLPEGTSVGGVVFVAGFFKRLTGFEDEPELQVTEKHWLTAPIDFQKIKDRLGKSIAIFSDDDPYVPLDNQDDFKDELGSEIIVEKKQKHFNVDDDDTQFPVIRDAVLKIAE